ncbi:MAG: helix-turn-helix transcriptional regulator [Candidatus Omnitrophota bacterium]
MSTKVTARLSMQNIMTIKPNIYVLQSELDMLELNPNYPSQPKTFGERLRKARMDKGMPIRDLAGLIGVTEDTVINWELRGMRPRKQYQAKIKDKLDVLVGL